MIRRSWVLAGVIALGTAHATGARAGVAVALGVDLDTPTHGTSTALDFSSKPGLPGGGLILDFQLGSGFGSGPGSEIVLDALYLTRSFRDGFNEVKGHRLQGDLLYRIVLGGILHLGGGAYYSSALGELTVDGASAAYSSYGLKGSDYGPVGSLALTFSLGSLTLYLDGRYGYGLSNSAANANQTFHHHDVVGLLGIRFGGSDPYAL
jgi:hypothetical protein